ncbi:unnamed protein product [Allacma fusca]|uniref:Uncharacterized protein n=1 Tax=Allacma fusca TaxID=39272 RepID=A0A8J2K0S4_9HEXA|nr:unnamed protein product [Allacma fusca]
MKLTTVIKSDQAKSEINLDRIRILQVLRRAQNSTGGPRISSKKLREKARSAAFYAYMHRLARPSVSHRVSVSNTSKPKGLSEFIVADQKSRESVHTDTGIIASTTVPEDIKTVSSQVTVGAVKKGYDVCSLIPTVEAQNTQSGP